MKVRCIDNNGTYLLLGDIYDVIEEVDNVYYLTGAPHWYYKKRFEIIPEKEENEKTNKKKIPEIIYLQWYSEDDEIEESDEVTWCEDRINNSDLIYKLVGKEE